MSQLVMDQMTHLCLLCVQTPRVPQAGRDLRRSLLKEGSELSSDYIAQACVLLGLESLQDDVLFLLSSSCTPGGYTQSPPQITLLGYFGLRSLAEQCYTAECSGSFRTQTFTDVLYFWAMPSPCFISLLLLNALGNGISRKASGDLWSLPVDLKNYI